MIYSKYILRVKRDDGIIIAITTFPNYLGIAKYIKAHKPNDGETYLITRVDYIEGGEEVSSVDNISIEFAEE